MKTPPVTLRIFAIVAAAAVTVATSVAPRRYEPVDGRTLFGWEGIIVDVRNVDVMGTYEAVTQIDAHFTLRNMRPKAVAISTRRASLEWEGERLLNTAAVDVAANPQEAFDFWIHVELPTPIHAAELPKRLTLTLAKVDGDPIEVTLRLR